VYSMPFVTHNASLIPIKVNAIGVILQLGYLVVFYTH
jgi:hypothetical protein